MQGGTKSTAGFSVMPKSPSVELGVHVNGLFGDSSRGPTRSTSPGFTFGKWKFLFNFCNEDLIGKPFTISSLPEETLAVPTLAVIILTSLEIFILFLPF